MSIHTMLTTSDRSAVPPAAPFEPQVLCTGSKMIVAYAGISKESEKRNERMEDLPMLARSEGYCNDCDELTEDDRNWKIQEPLGIVKTRLCYTVLSGLSLDVSAIVLIEGAFELADAPSVVLVEMEKSRRKDGAPSRILRALALITVHQIARDSLGNGNRSMNLCLACSMRFGLLQGVEDACLLAAETSSGMLWVYNSARKYPSVSVRMFFYR